MGKNVKVTKEKGTGLNTEFFDPSKNKTMTRGQFANAIERGEYPDYHIKHVKNGSESMRIPASNPDKKTNNNLG